jgi:predicted lipid-binding transport protein (Tim44 family)
MGSLIGLLVGKQIFGKVISERMARVIAHAGLFLLVAALIVGVIVWIRRDAVDDHEAKIAQRAAPATDRAASERATDTIANSRSAQERHDVIAAQPDQPIAPTSHALSCKRLRDAGVDSPACR